MQYMAPFNHTEIRYTRNCLVIKKQKVNVIRIGYKYSKIKIIFLQMKKNIDTRKTTLQFF